MTLRYPNSSKVTSRAAVFSLILSITVAICGCSRSPVDQSTRDHEFLEAVARGNAEAVRQGLKRGAHVEAKDSYGDTALLVALHQENRLAEQPGERKLMAEKFSDLRTVVNILLENGANIEVRDQNGATPLIAAVQNGDPAMIRLLLNKGANVEAQDQNGGSTALMEAASLGSSKIAEILLEKTLDKQAKNQALFAAIREAPAVMFISEPQPSARPAAAPPPETSELSDDGSRTVRLLLEKGADVDARDEQGQTPLIRAAEDGQAGIVNLLLDKGASIDARDHYGATALISAACGGCTVIDMGDTFDCVQSLLRRGANVWAKTRGGKTALMVAASYGQTNIVKLLLSKGANVTDKDSDGSTALILAAPSGVTTATGMVFTTDSVRLLLDHHSEVNARNKKGKTALIAAVSDSEATEATKIVRLLLNKGADASITDIHGDTALTLAKKNGYLDAVDLLEKAAANAR